MSELESHPHFSSATDLIAELANARREAAHWKANHDNLLEIKRALLDRPDLADRASRVAQLIEQRDLLRETSTQQTEVIETYKLTVKSLLEDLETARRETGKARDLLREVFEATTDIGTLRLSFLIHSIWPDLWERITKELEK